MRDRLEGQFAGEQAPIVDVKMQLLKRWKKVNAITFDAADCSGRHHGCGAGLWHGL